MNWPKLISRIFLALFLGIAAWAGVFFLQMNSDLTRLRAQEAAAQRRLAEARARLEEQQKYLDRLRHDPALVESVIRQKLGYVRSEEFIFRFEDGRTP